MPRETPAMFISRSPLPRYYTSRRSRDGRACFVKIGRAGTAVAAVRTTGASSVIRLQRRPVCGLKTGLRQTENKTNKKSN